MLLIQWWREMNRLEMGKKTDIALTIAPFHLSPYFLNSIEHSFPSQMEQKTIVRWKKRNDDDVDEARKDKSAVSFLWYFFFLFLHLSCLKDDSLWMTMRIVAQRAFSWRRFVPFFCSFFLVTFNLSLRYLWSPIDPQNPYYYYHHFILECKYG